MIGLGQVQTCPPGESLDPNLGLCASVASQQTQPAPNWYCGSFLSDWFGYGPCYPPYTPTPAVAPSTAVQMTVPGAWTPDQAIAATAAAQKQSAQQLMGSVAAANQPFNPLASLNLPSLDPSTWSIGTWVLVIGGVLVVGWMANDILARH